MNLKVRSICIVGMSVLLLSGCSLNLPGISSGKSHEESHQKNKQKTAEMSSKKRLAKLKAENESLKKKQSESLASSSAKSASESIVSASESVQAASEAAKNSAASAATSASTAAISESSAHNATAKDGSNADTVRNVLIENFGCDPEVLAGIPDSTLVAIYSDAMAGGEDISGLYKQVYDVNPNIGGDILGHSADN